MSQSSFPLWIEDRLVEDARFAAAYDALGSRLRGACKLALARTETVFGGAFPGNEIRRVEARGTTHAAYTAPVPWAFFMMGHGFASPSRLLAALMPAVLAGVPEILVCRVRGGITPAPFPDALLTALELAGQETVADLSPREARKLVEYSCEHAARGRIVFLGPFLGSEHLLLAALRSGFPCRAEFVPPRIAVTPAAMPFFEEGEQANPAGDFWPSFGYLRFAQPDAVIVTLPEEELPGMESYSCVLCGEEEAGAWLRSAPLVLTPGEEACWLWPDITPAFFRETRRAIM